MTSYQKPTRKKVASRQKIQILTDSYESLFKLAKICRLTYYPHERIKHILSKNLDVLTSMQTYRPQNLNIYIKFYVEPEIEGQNKQFLHLG